MPELNWPANPKATPAEIEEALSGNICRCGTYEQMRHAIAELCGKTDADTFVAGSAIFGSSDYAATIRAMRERIAR